MRNVWELSQLANILKVKISEFQIFAESLPKSYGISISEDKLMITQTILNDISDHLMERFASWKNEKKQRLNKDEDKNSFSFDDIIISDKESPSKFSEKRVKIAVYGDTPLRVVINEAVELAKDFGADTSPRFVNGVLGSVVTDVAALKATFTDHEDVVAD